MSGHSTTNPEAIRRGFEAMHPIAHDLAIHSAELGNVHTAHSVIAPNRLPRTEGFRDVRCETKVRPARVSLGKSR